MDSSTYENLRNLTLLFFIEKLVEKPTRSLHDLSCQFGSKGFSREMRQIAGGSQSGLRKFLQSYPSIFTLDNENVTYTSTSIVKEKPNQDYNSQAVEYFRSRLIQYGIGVQVPIKSLLGHRSQASPQVRHISGQHIKEFTSFLSSNPSVFKIIDESVVLVEFETELPAREFKEIDIRVDKSIIYKYIQFFGDILEKHGPLLVDQLLVGIGNQFPECSELFKSVQDLNVFLKFHPQCFQVHSNLVTLTDSYNIALEHLQRQSQESIESNNQVNNNSTNVTNNNIQESTDGDVPMLDRQLSLNNGSSNKQAAVAAEKPIVNAQTSKAPTIEPLMKISIDLPKPLHPSSVANSAEKSNTNSTAHNNKANAEIISNKPENGTTGNTTSTRPLIKKESSLSQRLNSIVMKTLTENISRDYNIKTKEVVNNENVLELMSLCNEQPTETNLDSLKNCIVNRTTIVANVRRCKIIVDEMIGFGQPVSVDCEGVNLGQNGTVTLLQLCNSRGSVFIFDLMSEPRMSSTLNDLLTSSAVVKIMHDCRNDSVNLYNQFGVQLQNLFDTQAAHVVVEMSEGNGKTESKVKNTSLNGLCQNYQIPYNPFKDKVKSVYRHDQKFWSRRPLTKQMIAYAACDVLILPVVHEKLEPKLKNNIELFVDLCNENIMCHISADEIKSKRRMRKNNADLMELRAKLDSASPTNLVLSNREMRLLKHLELSQTDKEKLSSSIKVARKLEKLSSAKFESSSESNESNPPSLEPNQMQEMEDTSKMNLESLDAMVTYLFSADASTQTVITMEDLDQLNLSLPQV